MTPERLQELIDRFPSRRIAVFGDYFLDKYLDVDPALAETSLETAKTAHQVVAIRHSPGAAGTVVDNLAALQAGRLHAVGAVGDDGEALDLRRGLDRLGCRCDGLLQFESLMTPTYLKPRNVTDAGLTGEHERYDTQNRRRMPDEIVGKVIGALDAALPELDAVIIVDQVEADDRGIVTAGVRELLAERARKHPDVIFWADSRSHVRSFRGVIIKPNQFEATGRANPLPDEEVPLDELREAVRRLRAEIGAPVCATRGERGVLVSDPQLTEVPGVRLDGPTDPTGAGDSATAGAVLALTAGATLPEAALIGNLVASITVEQLATTGTAHPEQLVDRLELWREQNSG